MMFNAQETIYGSLAGLALFIALPILFVYHNVDDRGDRGIAASKGFLIVSNVFVDPEGPPCSP